MTMMRVFENDARKFAAICVILIEILIFSSQIKFIFFTDEGWVYDCTYVFRGKTACN